MKQDNGGGSMTTRVKMIAGLVCCAVLLWGCGTRWVRETVVEQRHLEVSLEHKVVDGEMAKQPFNHPLDIEKEKMCALLDHLQYLKNPLVFGDPEKVAVFQQVELERLTPALVDALGRATANKRVRFISYNTGGGLFFKKQRRTGGVMFVDASGQLNLAFSYINQELRDEEVRRSGTAQLYTDPLTIDTSDNPVLAPGTAVRHRIKDGKKMPMWLVADIDRLDADSLSEAQSVEPRPSGAPSGESSGAVEPEVEPKPEPEAEARPPVSPDTRQDQWEQQKADIREKLQYLKELHEAELINEKEYEAQKEKLLEQITPIPES